MTRRPELGLESHELCWADIEPRTLLLTTTRAEDVSSYEDGWCILTTVILSFTPRIGQAESRYKTAWQWTLRIYNTQIPDNMMSELAHDSGEGGGRGRGREA